MATAGEELRQAADQPQGAEVSTDAPVKDEALTQTDTDIEEGAAPKGDEESEQSEFDEFEVEHPEMSLDEIDALREREKTEEEEHPSQEGEQTKEQVEKDDEPKHKIKFNGEEREYSLEALKNLAQQGLNFQQQHGEFKPILDQARQHGFDSNETGRMIGVGARVIGFNQQALQRAQPGSLEHATALLASLGYQPQFSPQQQQPQVPQQQPGEPEFINFLEELSPGAKSYFDGLIRDNQEMKQQVGRMGQFWQFQNQRQQQAAEQKFQETITSAINKADAELTKAEEKYGVTLDGTSRAKYLDFVGKATQYNPDAIPDPRYIASFMALEFPDAQARVVGKVVAEEELQRRRDAAQAGISGPSAPSGPPSKGFKSAWDEDAYTLQARREGRIP